MLNNEFEYKKVMRIKWIVISLFVGFIPILGFFAVKFDGEYIQDVAILYLFCWFHAGVKFTSTRCPWCNKSFYLSKISLSVGFLWMFRERCSNCGQPNLAHNK